MELILVILPALVWCFYRLTLPNQRWEFDFDQAHCSFNLLLTRYVGVLCFVIALDLITVAVGRYRNTTDAAVACVLAGAGYAFVLIVWLCVQYEIYLHHRYPKTGMPGESPYTTSRYALTRTLAWSAVIFSMMGVVMGVWL